MTVMCCGQSVKERGEGGGFNRGTEGKGGGAGRRPRKHTVGFKDGNAFIAAVVF